MGGLSTLTEILLRGEIYAISRSVIRPEIWILIFRSGDQANIDNEVFKKLEISV